MARKGSETKSWLVVHSLGRTIRLLLRRFRYYLTPPLLLISAIFDLSSLTWLKFRSDWAKRSDLFWNQGPVQFRGRTGELVAMHDVVFRNAANCRSQFA